MIPRLTYSAQDGIDHIEKACHSQLNGRKDDKALRTAARPQSKEPDQCAEHKADSL